MNFGKVYGDNSSQLFGVSQSVEVKSMQEMRVLAR